MQPVPRNRPAGPGAGSPVTRSPVTDPPVTGPGWRA